LLIRSQNCSIQNVNVIDGIFELNIISKLQVASQMIRDAVKVYLMQRRAIKRIQAVARRYLARVQFKHLLKRTRIAKEIVQTEETYVNSLNTMVKVRFLCWISNENRRALSLLYYPKPSKYIG
jgi:hypothetical protein